MPHCSKAHGLRYWHCMKEQINVLKLTVLTASVAAFGVGCASSGYARYDNDSSNHAMGASASADVGSASAGVSASADADTTPDANIRTDMDTHMDHADINDHNHRSHRYHDSRYSMDDRDHESAGEARETVSAMSFTAVTNARQVNQFPFYDWPLRSIDTYTFAVPDPDVNISARSDLPQFSVNLPPGSIYVESAGGAGEVKAGRVIQHSPNPGIPSL